MGFWPLSWEGTRSEHEEDLDRPPYVVPVSPVVRGAAELGETVLCQTDHESAEENSSDEPSPGLSVAEDPLALPRLPEVHGGSSAHEGGERVGQQGRYVNPESDTDDRQYVSEIHSSTFAPLSPSIIKTSRVE